MRINALAIVDACGSCPDEHATLVRRWSAVAFQASADQLFESLRARDGPGIYVDSAKLIHMRQYYMGRLLVRANILACGPPDGGSLATTRHPSSQDRAEISLEPIFACRVSHGERKTQYNSE
jgi:hypothetical protein